jgi:hypothetical protein
MATDDQDAPRTVLSRRNLLTAAGVAGVAAASVGIAGGASAGPERTTERSPAGARQPDGERANVMRGPVVVHVTDAAGGVLDIYTGDAHRQVRDHDLAARLAHAAATA